jgi:hypothetical protein
MLKINFLPDSDLEDFSVAISEYELIWKEDGQKIVKTLEEVSALSFQETYINALVFNVKNPARSHPLSLKKHLTVDEKKLSLVHELGHRIMLPSLKIRFKSVGNSYDSFGNHKALDLILYDVYENLYGKSFADYAVKWDSEKIGGLYKEAWDFALSFKTKEERQKKFKEMVAV